MARLVGYTVITAATVLWSGGCEQEAPTKEDVLVAKLEGQSRSKAYAEMLSPLGGEVGFNYRVEKALATCHASVPPQSSWQPDEWELTCSWRFAEIYGGQWASRMKQVYATASSDAYRPFWPVCSPSMSIDQILIMIESLKGRNELGMAWKVLSGALAKHPEMARRERIRMVLGRATPNATVGPAPRDLEVLDDMPVSRLCGLIKREREYWGEKTMVAWMLKACVGGELGDAVWQCALETSVPEYRRLLGRLGEAELSFDDQHKIVRQPELVCYEAAEAVIAALESPSISEPLNDNELRGLERWKSFKSDFYEVPCEGTYRNRVRSGPDSHRSPREK